MNRKERRSRKKMAVAVEDCDLKRDAAVVENLRRRAPRRLRDQCRDVEVFRAGEIQDLPGAIGGFCMRDDIGISAGFRAARREPGKIDFPTARMEVKKALAELCHFGEATRERHIGDRVRAQVFQHAAYKIASISAMSGNPCSAFTAASEVDPVDPAIWESPAAQATSIPR